MSEQLPGRGGGLLGLFFLLGLSLLGACSPPVDFGFAIAVSVRFDDAIDEARRADIRSLVVTSSGDEAGSYTQLLPAGAAVVEGFLYRPQSSSRSLALRITARDSTSAIAEGKTDLLTLSPGKTTAVEVVLYGPNGGDGGAGEGPTPVLAFAHAERYLGCSGASETAVGDYDGDGRADIAVACPTAGTVQVFLCAADGSFPSSASTTTTVFSATGLAAVDFDADAHVDLVAVSSDGAHLLRNDGQGHFGDLATRPLIGALGALAADFDKDGVLDLLISGSSTAGRVLWGSGVAGTAFSTATALTLAGAASQALAVDLNGDGYLDVAVVETAASKVETFMNSQLAPARSFAPAVTLGLGSAAYSMVFQDVNNDGKPEALYSEGSGGSYGFAVLSNTNGVLARTNSASLIGRGGLPMRDMLLVDIDKDGVADLVMLTGSGNYVVVRKGLGPLQFDTSAGDAYWPGSNSGRVHIADFEQDGFADLVFVDGDGFTVVRGGTAPILRAAEVFSFLESDSVGPLRAQDLDQDGDVDVLALDGSTSHLFSYVNDGKGELSRTGSLASAAVAQGCGSARGLALGDVDNDGHIDIVRVTRFCYDVVLGLANGVLSQGPASSLVAGAEYAEGVGLADLDEDGKLDLVLLAAGIGQLQVLPGLGDGRFVAPTSTSVSSPFRLVLADVDGDAHVDVVVAGQQGLISTYLNDGHGVLGAPTTVTGPSGLGEIAVVDYDADQLVDLIAVGSSLYQFKGGPGFSDSTRSSRSLLTPWRRVAVADFNRDGHLDLMGSTSLGIEIFTGAGSQVFTAAHAFNMRAGPGPLVVADFEGDRLPDLILRGAADYSGAARLRNLSH